MFANSFHTSIIEMLNTPIDMILDTFPTIAASYNEIVTKGK
jgi:hypothetical protein